jgi:hypothetical protein
LFSLPLPLTICFRDSLADLIFLRHIDVGKINSIEITAIYYLPHCLLQLFRV